MRLAGVAATLILLVVIAVVIATALNAAEVFASPNVQLVCTMTDTGEVVFDGHAWRAEQRGEQLFVKMVPWDPWTLITPAENMECHIK